jgi:hypothetical protein
LTTPEVVFPPEKTGTAREYTKPGDWHHASNGSHAVRMRCRTKLIAYHCIAAEKGSDAFLKCVCPLFGD